DEPRPLFLIATRGERGNYFEDLGGRRSGTPPSEELWTVVRYGLLGNQTVRDVLALRDGAIPMQQAAFLRAMNKLAAIAHRPPEEWKPLLDVWIADTQQL